MGIFYHLSCVIYFVISSHSNLRACNHWIADNKSVPRRTPSSSDHRLQLAKAKERAPLPPANHSAAIALLKSRPFYAHSTQTKQELVRVICDAAKCADLAAYVPPGARDDHPHASAVVDPNTVAFALGFYSKATGPFPHHHTHWVMWMNYAPVTPLEHGLLRSCLPRLRILCNGILSTSA